MLRARVYFSEIYDQPQTAVVLGDKEAIGTPGGHLLVSLDYPGGLQLPDYCSALFFFSDWIASNSEGLSFWLDMYSNWRNIEKLIRLDFR